MIAKNYLPPLAQFGFDLGMIFAKEKIKAFAKGEFMHFMAILFATLSFIHADAATGRHTSRGVFVSDCETILNSSPYQNLASLDFNVPKIIFVIGKSAVGKTFTFRFGLGVLLAARYGNDNVRHLNTMAYGAELRGSRGENLYYPTDAKILVLDHFHIQNLSSLDAFLIDRLSEGKTTFVILKGVGYLMELDQVLAVLSSKKEMLARQMETTKDGTKSSFEILNVNFE